MADIDDKVVAITGASSGIGEATARLLAARGAAVVLGARRTDRLDQVARDITDGGGRALVCRTDVTRREDVERLVDATVARFGRLDVMVNNAGIAHLGLMDGLDVDGWSAMIDVNVGGVLNGIAAALPIFRSQGHGHLVTTLSTSGLKITPMQAVYAGTKNAVRTLLEGLRQESTDGVLRTTSISPGMVHTEFSDRIAESWSDREEGEALTGAVADLGLDPEAVARAIAFAIEQPSDVEVGDITIRPTRQG